MVVVLVRVLGTGLLSQRFLMSSKVFASYISDEARSLLASLSSDLFLISSLGPLLLQPRKVISVAQTHLCLWMLMPAQRAVTCCPGNSELESKEREPTDSSWEDTCWMLQDKMPGYLTRMAECLQKEDREPVMGNLLLFDELAPDHARRTVVFTVHKICAKQSGDLQAVRISPLKMNCFMAWYV